MTKSDAGREPLVDPARLARWLDEAGLGGDGLGGDGLGGDGLGGNREPEIERITTGHSNEVFLIRRGGAQWVLRRPPRTPLSPTAHDMAREFQLLSALSASNAAGAGHALPHVPIPEPVAFSPDAIGVPAYLMEPLDGLVVREAMPPLFAADPGAPTANAHSLLDLLVTIHAVDWRRAGLGEFGRPDGYLTRQVPRWTGQLDRYRTRALPEVDEAAAWLANNTPEMQSPTIIHGDYKLDNVMFAPSLPVSPLAVLDWEQATIGDPLVDLGWLLGLWCDPGDSPVFGGANAALLGHGEVPTRSQMSARYSEASGRDLTHLDFYCVLGLFKLACVMEGSYARFKNGTSDDALFSFLEEGVPALARRALEFA
ncbi:MAG: phosphotransferase family protein, partial [Actinomycetes bacterium]